MTSFFLLLLLRISSAQLHPPTVFSTVFTADDVDNLLSSVDGLNSAVAFAKEAGLGKIYLETWRTHRSNRTVLVNAKARFVEAGIVVAGCVCTTGLGKIAQGWNLVSCYSNTSTQMAIRAEFEFAASLFDEIIIDDFYFTDCTCSECTRANASATVTVDSHVVSVPHVHDDSCVSEAAMCPWKDYRQTLMTEVSRWLVIAPSKKVNPNVKVIIKYPNWYDAYQDMGYDVAAESPLFDGIFVGTETRNYADSWGGKPGYFGFFIQRWFSTIDKRNGGGWYDTLHTDPMTFVEQARSTVLGGAKESFWFNYGDLVTGDGAADYKALLPLLTEIREISAQILSREIVGIAAYKPPSSHSGCIQDPEEQGTSCKEETNVFDFVGALGFPLFPVSTFPASAASAFFSIQSLKDRELVPQLATFLRSGRPMLVTDGLIHYCNCNASVDWNASNVHILHVNHNPPGLIVSPPRDIDNLRQSLTAPLGLLFSAPANVSLFPFSDGSWVIHNFGDAPALFRLNNLSSTLPPHDWLSHWA